MGIVPVTAAAPVSLRKSRREGLARAGEVVLSGMTNASNQAASCRLRVQSRRTTWRPQVSSPNPVTGLYVPVPVVLGVALWPEPLSLRKACGMVPALIALVLLTWERGL
jgi:hypothetical protein